MAKRYEENSFNLQTGVYLKAATMKEWKLTQTAIETNGKRYMLADIARVKHDPPANKMLQGVVQIFMKDGKFHTLGYAFSQKEKAAKAVDYINGVVNKEIDISEIPVDTTPVKKPRKGLKILLIVLAVFVAIGVIGSMGGKKPATNGTGSSPAVTKSPKEIREEAKEATEKLKNPYNIQIFRDGTKFGLKRDDKVISDPVWSSINEVIDGDLVYYVVGYYDKARGDALRKEYDSTIISYDEFFGIVDAEGNIVVKPDYWNISCGTMGVKTKDGYSRIVPYESDYIVASDYVDNGKVRNYVSLNSGEKSSKKERSKVDYFIRKGTWEVAFDLGLNDFQAFYGDYITFNTPLRTGGGVYSISQRREIVNVEGTSGSWTYYPGIGFTAKFTQGAIGDAKNSFIFLNGTVIKSEAGTDIVVDQEDQLILAERKLKVAPYGTSHPYRAYTADGQAVGGGITMDKPSLEDKVNNGTSLSWICENGDRVQLVYDSDAKIRLFNYNTKELILIPDAQKVAKWSEGYCAVMNEAGKWAYIDTKGNFICNYQFDKAEFFKGGKASVTIDYKIHTVDTNGNVD